MINDALVTILNKMLGVKKDLYANTDDVKDYFALAEFCFSGCKCGKSETMTNVGCPNEPPTKPPEKAHHFDVILVATLTSITIIILVLSAFIVMRRIREKKSRQKKDSIQSHNQLIHRRPLPEPMDRPSYLDLCEVSKLEEDEFVKFNKTGTKQTIRYTDRSAVNTRAPSALSNRPTEEDGQYLNPLEPNQKILRKRTKSTTADSEEHEYAEVHTYYEF